MLCILLLVNDVMYSIYVGETSQMLRSRMNNRRTSTKGFKPLYLYNHFNSDNHSFDDALIMPIEQIPKTPNSTILLYKNVAKLKRDTLSLPARHLHR